MPPFDAAEGIEVLFEDTGSGPSTVTVPAAARTTAQLIELNCAGTQGAAVGTADGVSCNGSAKGFGSCACRWPGKVHISVPPHVSWRLILLDYIDRKPITLAGPRAAQTRGTHLLVTRTGWGAARPTFAKALEARSGVLWLTCAGNDSVTGSKAGTGFPSRVGVPTGSTGSTLYFRTDCGSWAHPSRQRILVGPLGELDLTAPAGVGWRLDFYAKS